MFLFMRIYKFIDKEVLEKSISDFQTANSDLQYSTKLPLHVILK